MPSLVLSVTPPPPNVSLAENCVGARVPGTPGLGGGVELGMPAAGPSDGISETLGDFLLWTAQEPTRISPARKGPRFSFPFLTRSHIKDTLRRMRKTRTP